MAKKRILLFSGAWKSRGDKRCSPLDRASDAGGPITGCADSRFFAVLTVCVLGPIGVLIRYMISCHEGISVNKLISYFVMSQFEMDSLILMILIP